MDQQAWQVTNKVTSPVKKLINRPVLNAEETHKDPYQPKTSLQLRRYDKKVKNFSSKSVKNENIINTQWDPRTPYKYCDPCTGKNFTGEKAYRRQQTDWRSEHLDK